MKLTVLCDNYTIIDRYLLGEPALSFYLEDNGRINAAGTREYLYGIADMVAVQLNIDDYIGSVVEKSRLRKINMAFTRFAQLSAHRFLLRFIVVFTAQHSLFILAHSFSLVKHFFLLFFEKFEVLNRKSCVFSASLEAACT